MRFLLSLIVILIPFRDWNFSIGFDFYGIDIFAVLVSILYVLQYLINPHKLSVSEVIVVFGLLTAIPISAISIFNGLEYFNHGLIGLIKLAIYTIVVLAFIREIKKQDFRYFLCKIQLKYFNIFAVLALINFVTIGLYHYDWLGDFFDSISIRGPETINHLELSFWTRNTSFAGEPNFLAIYALLHYGVVLVSDQNNFSRAIQVMLIVLLAISTFSRVVILLLPILIILNEFRFDFKSVSIYLILILLIFVTLNSLVHIDEYVREVYNSILARDLTGDDGRLQIFRQALDIWRESPLGVGVSNYGMASFDMHGDMGEPNPHNGFLTLLVEQGIIGVMVKIVFYMHILFSVYRRIGWRVFFTILFILSSLLVNNFDKILGFDLLILLIGYDGKN